MNENHCRRTVIVGFGVAGGVAPALVLLAFAIGCSGSSSNAGSPGGTASITTGGALPTGGVSSVITTGGSLGPGGSASTGGASSSTSGGQSVAPTGGRLGTGGSAGSGGSSAIATGGTAAATGGKANASGGTSAATGGKANASGGTAATGGSVSSTGGTQAATGGKSSGTTASTTGGKSSSGGASAIGGTSPAGGSTAAGGSTGYNPCPASGACKILPLGDSITYGLQSTDGSGYRGPLFKTALQANQSITFTGSQQSGPTTINGVTFPRDNEGHSGWTIDQIAGLVPSPAFDTIPNIVLLMAGTNDVYASSGQSTMNTRLGNLIDKVVAAAPDALLVVATLTPLSNTSWNATATTYDGQIPAVVQARASQGKHVIMVNMSQMPVSELSDGIHPNDTGYAYMASVWYAAIKDVI